MTDRPWGLTLGALLRRRLTGQLTLQTADGKLHRIACHDGAIVGATSPSPSDTAGRIALAMRLITTYHNAELAARISAQPERDDIEILVELLPHLEPDGVLALRQRALAQRTARTFGVDDGSFVIEDVISIPVTLAAAVDLRVAVLLGIRSNLSEERLTADLRALGAVFTLRPEAEGELLQFGLTAGEAAILPDLRTGTTLPQLEARHRDLDPRLLRSVVYALVACCACTAEAAPAPLRAAGGDVVFRPTPRAPGVDPSRACAESTGPTAVPPSPRAPTPPRTPTPTDPPAATRATPIGRTQTPRPARPPTGNPPQESDPSRGRTPSTDPGARPVIVNARTEPRPTTIVPPQPPSAGRTPSGRPLVPRPASTAPTRPPNVGTDTSGAHRVVDPNTLAAEAFKRGQSALRAEQFALAIEELTQAVTLNPSEFDYHAVLAWAQFLGASNRVAMADKVRKMLGHAIQKSHDPELARFYLGRMERMLGRDREALRHFRRVLDAEPKHTEAAIEARLLEQRLAAGSDEKPGIASLFRKRHKPDS